MYGAPIANRPIVKRAEVNHASVQVRHVRVRAEHGARNRRLNGETQMGKLAPRNAAVDEGKHLLKSTR
jgi:hypothetical protein